jgi:hypothetical protein
MRPHRIDDPAPAALLHGWVRRHGCRENQGQVNGDDRVPLPDRELLDRRHELEACIIEEDVDRAKALLSQRQHLGNLDRLARIRRQIEPLHLECGLDGRALLLDISRSAKTIENEVGASTGERAG